MGYNIRTGKIAYSPKEGYHFIDENGFSFPFVERVLRDGLWMRLVPTDRRNLSFGNIVTGGILDGYLVQLWNDSVGIPITCITYKPLIPPDAQEHVEGPAVVIKQPEERPVEVISDI